MAVSLILTPFPPLQQRHIDQTPFPFQSGFGFNGGMCGAAALLCVLSDAAGRSRCFAFWQEFSKACFDFSHVFFFQSLLMRILVLRRNGQPQRMQPTSRRLLGVSASH